MYVTTISEKKEANNLRKSREGYINRLGGRKDKEEI